MAGAVVVLGGMGYWGYSLHGQVDSAKSDVAAATIERDELRSQLGAFQAAQARDAARRPPRRGGRPRGRPRQLGAHRARPVGGHAAPGVAHQPEGRDRRRGHAGAPAAAAAPNVNNSTAPRGLHLDGFAFTQNQVALLMARASTVPGLGEPRLATSEVQVRADRDVIHFVIDIPIDQRAQDRSALTPVNGQATSAASGVTP